MLPFNTVQLLIREALGTLIPILELTRQYSRFASDINKTLTDVAASGYYILGPNVKAFEEEMAQYLGVNHAVGCASGTDALLLAMKALKIGAGDEVITTPFTFIATSEAIVQAGASPVFVDIDPDSFNLNVQELEAKISAKTKAILPVHLYGLPANMDEIKALAESHKLFIIEDCAQAIGADYKGQKVGSIGDIGCFSFFPTKNLGAFGDGGLLSTNNEELAARLRMLRMHGSQTRYHHEESGLNSRLDEMQAAILRIKLPHIDEFNQSRQKLAQKYNQLLAPFSEYITAPSIPENMTHVFHQYTIKLKTDCPERRNAFQDALRDEGVMSMLYYPIPLYEQKTHQNLGCQASDYPVCETLRHQVLSLPMFPELSETEQNMVAQGIEKALAKVFQATAV